MIPIPRYTPLVTLLAVGFYFFLATRVARTRIKFNVGVPATSGHPNFDRIFRVHVNTLEWMPTFLIPLWLCAVYLSDATAAVLGLVWIAGRAWYFPATANQCRDASPGSSSSRRPASRCSGDPASRVSAPRGGSPAARSRSACPRQAAPRRCPARVFHEECEAHTQEFLRDVPRRIARRGAQTVGRVGDFALEGVTQHLLPGASTARLGVDAAHVRRTLATACAKTSAPAPGRLAPSLNIRWNSSAPGSPAYRPCM